ncbi:MAG: hypothetical protein GF317_16855 [Candidatus Lokiarchaeota archaeon]|nr:hypothetical protein [Candidatus Lokiarchaeota archaeon]MBD3201188.1 hypothetical protein [Candidatus Lokiarchaeota archaeon]
MPLEDSHILNFLDNPVNDRYKSEILDLLIQRINDLCFKECQVDRISCTLTPLCSRRFLLRLRIKNELGMEDLPKFCYSVHKGVVERDFRGKTVVYKPSDSYLFLIDFLDIFFHGDYRKLNKFISFKNWKDALEIFEERIANGESFRYVKSENYFVFKYEDRLHIIFLNKDYVLTNANRENIESLELIKDIIELNSSISFPEIRIILHASQFVEVKVKIPFDIISKLNSDGIASTEGEKKENPDYYFWHQFPKDLEKLSGLCDKITLQMNQFNDLMLTLFINKETYTSTDESRQNIPLRYRDLEEIIDFIEFLYTKFYIIWV